MPGDVYLTDTQYGANYGYGQDYGAVPAVGNGGGSAPSHGSFIAWLVVLAVASGIILHGLKLGGFTFLFRR
jgi:hypothetical protein